MERMVFAGFLCCLFFFFKQKTAYEMRISDWSSDVCSSDLHEEAAHRIAEIGAQHMAREPRRECRFGDPIAVPIAGATAFGEPRSDRDIEQIGRASGRERVCQYVLI